MPRRKRYPFVQHFTDRNGRARLYFRKPGFPRIPLPGPYGGPEFLVAYYAALAGNPDEIGSSRTIPRSMNALVVAYYASADFKSLRPNSARVYRNILERFREEHGDKSAAGMKARHVRALMAEKAATPDAANRLLGLISILMEHAIAAGWREDNPAFGVNQIQALTKETRKVFGKQREQNKNGRGSRIRTCDLKYPKLPRYQTALCPAKRPLPFCRAFANMRPRREQGRHPRRGRHHEQQRHRATQ